MHLTVNQATYVYGGSNPSRPTLLTINKPQLTVNFFNKLTIKRVNKTFRFKSFSVYNDSRFFYQKIIILADKIKIYSLRDQILRASLSIVLNIAEGSAKKSDKDFARFLENSIGSVNEVVACLDVLLDLKIIEKDLHYQFIAEAEKITKQLGGFIKKLRSFR